MEPTLVSTDEIREILARRIDHQKQAVGIVVGVIEPNGRRVVGYGNLAKSDPRTVGGDTVFEIGSVTKVFTSLLLGGHDGPQRGLRAESCPITAFISRLSERRRSLRSIAIPSSPRVVPHDRSQEHRLVPCQLPA